MRLTYPFTDTFDPKLIAQQDAEGDAGQSVM